MTKQQLPPVFILAGGQGTRYTEETSLKPKPMIEIGGIPLLLHIMRWYYSFGFNDFVICAGYKGWDIKQFFINYTFMCNHMVIDHRKSESEFPKALGKSFQQESWRIRVIDTGELTMTGARVAKAIDIISEADGFDDFALTYGDGVCDVDILKEYNFHLEMNKLGTILAVRPLARFGDLDVRDDFLVPRFIEKPEEKAGFINGGFFFFKKDFRRYLSNDEDCILERKPLEKLAKEKQLVAFKHLGFWQCMDTLRDKIKLQEMWETGNAPWKPKK